MFNGWKEKELKKEKKSKVKEMKILAAAMKETMQEDREGGIKDQKKRFRMGEECFYYKTEGHFKREYQEAEQNKAFSRG